MWTAKPVARRQIVADVHVSPAELRRVEHSAGRLFDHARDDEPDAVAFSRRPVGFEEPSDALGEVGDEALGVDDGVERVAGDGGAAEIGQHEVGAAESDVDGDDEAVVRAHVEHHGLSAARRVDGCALVNRPRPRAAH